MTSLPILSREYYFERPQHKRYTAKELKIDGLACFGFYQHKTRTLCNSLHYHPGCFEFHYVVDATMTFRVEKTAHRAQSGYVFVTQPDEPHCLLRNSYPGYHFYWFQIAEGGSFLGLSARETDLLIQRLKGLKHRVIPASESMKAAVTNAFEQVSADDDYSRGFAANQLASFLYQLIRQDANMEQTALSQEINQAIRFMQEHVHARADIPAMADAAGFSVSYFNARFKKETGIPPSDYYKSLQIEEAKRLLREGYSVTETANTLNFSSPNYFSTVFRQSTDATPTQFVKHIRHHEKNE